MITDLSAPDLTLGIEATRRERSIDAAPEHGVMLRLNSRF